MSAYRNLTDERQTVPPEPFAYPRVVLGSVRNLPDPEQGVLLIVPPSVKRALPERLDLVTASRGAVAR